VGDTPLCPSGSQVRSRSNHCFNRIKKIRARDNNCHWYCKDRENDITRKVKLEAFSLTVFMTLRFSMTGEQIWITTLNSTTVESDLLG